SERHRHRYEFNREYEEMVTAHGLDITGTTPDGTYVEVVEIRDHPWFLGCQFHPEFKSRPLEPHPLFKAFIGAAYEHRKQRQGAQASAAKAVSVGGAAQAEVERVEAGHEAGSIAHG
ncbi:MAG TPA: gamma-glutamyl-gamma-aminobutyrate hydrolase family protein, partial [Terriglobia bacterium]|nr:gamma-glutamyl-gamma-aminobutyrate hydrolase family protein [Terriglobia bacterium]